MTNARTTLHLWDSEHDYMGPEGSFFENGWHTEMDSFAEFLAESEVEILHYNLLYRWDWRKDHGENEDEERLELFFVMQRKGLTFSFSIKVTEDDEPAVLKWLTPRAQYIAKLWEPIWQGGSA